MNKYIYALGFFDGVHLGHQQLLKECCRLAAEHGCSTAAITFDRHPKSLFTDTPTVLISTIPDRKLLLHSYEIRKMFDKVRLKGYTLVPLRIYLRHGKAKMEVALAKGKNLVDKRETQKLRDAKREMEKALKLTR